MSPALSSVLVVPADPELGGVAFVSAPRRAVEDPVVAHQELEAACRGPVGLVHDAVVVGERAEAGALGEVARGVGAARARAMLDARRHSCLEHRREYLARLLLGA